MGPNLYVGYKFIGVLSMVTVLMFPAILTKGFTRISKRFRTELITKSRRNTRWEATQRVMATKLHRM